MSRVFNNPDQVREQTRNDVLSAAQSLGYRPNASARTLRTQRSHVLGVILPTLTNPVFAECLQGIAHATAKNGLSMMPATTDYDIHVESEAINTLLSFGIDGALLVVSDAKTSGAVTHLKSAGIPYVLVYNRHPEHPCISVDSEAALAEQVHELINLGHKRIAMVCGLRSASDRAALRHSAFERSMREAGLEPAPLIEVSFMQAASEAIASALAQPDRPTALVCSNDLLAIRAMRAAQQVGLHVPDELSITGFDGIAIGQDITPALSTIVQPNQHMGRFAVELLVQAIRRQAPLSAADSITLPYQIQRGESCTHPAGSF